MASRIGSLARLTLYSGPNCSLCDTAKAELAKLRQRRPFELQTINIQDAGQERWKKKYVYWIPALHIEGKEVAKGRWDAQTVDHALDAWEQAPWTDASKPEDVLGLPDPGPEGAPRCFNCGVSGHIVSGCPERHNHALIALSRQLHNFIKGDYAGGFRRIHEVEEWRQQRLAWLEHFEPGQIKGPLLREALGLQEGDIGENVRWLRNMVLWGYPKGWFADIDPREYIWKTISGDAETYDSDEDEDSPLCIFGEHGDKEQPTRSTPSGTLSENTEECDNTSDSESLSSTTLSESSRAVGSPQRWATYPNTHFLSSVLPVYNGLSLPPSDAFESAFVAHLQAFWSRLVPQHSAGDSGPDRQQYSDSIEHLWSYPIPPPLPPPPPPPSTTPPPLPVSSAHTLKKPETVPWHCEAEENYDSDMDLSD
ncbi:hypothetical protein B0H21DRAFT_887736 [Amylocystis lapponica]|nr:hypothetical protein B0H21DRAFT_887736 [Amylocystis lapponica]